HREDACRGRRVSESDECPQIACRTSRHSAPPVRRRSLLFRTDGYRRPAGRSRTANSRLGGRTVACAWGILIAYLAAAGLLPGARDESEELLRQLEAARSLAQG